MSSSRISPAETPPKPPTYTTTTYVTAPQIAPRSAKVITQPGQRAVSEEVIVQSSQKVYDNPPPTSTYTYKQPSSNAVQPTQVYYENGTVATRIIPASYGGGIQRSYEDVRAYDEQIVKYGTPVYVTEQPSVGTEIWDEVIKPVGTGLGAIVASPFILVGGVVVGAGAAVGSVAYGAFSTAKGFMGIVPVTQTAATNTMAMSPRLQRIDNQIRVDAVSDSHSFYDTIKGDATYLYDCLPWANNGTVQPEPQRITYLPQNYPTVYANDVVPSNRVTYRPITANQALGQTDSRYLSASRDDLDLSYS